ncbi:MAG TPA: AraC family transcriptional regulator [Opitutaceae bacterium]|nr:AraC family transcriptional regulator [Opitutaceae bacterium]
MPRQLVFFLPGMHASFQKIQLHEDSSIYCLRSKGIHFTTHWHFHPEHEFMFVERSRGIRLIGDSVEPFSDGDLVLVGPNVPHVWLNNDLPRPLRHDHAVAIFVQFRESAFSPALKQIPEFAHIPALLQRSRHGVHFTGPEASEAAEHLQRMARTAGVPRLTELLVVLDLLAHSPHQRVLSSANYVPKLNHIEAQRVERVCHYVNWNLTEKISQPAAARIAGMTETSFCRFFRRKMRCTFSAYVIQLRIARAIQLMIEKGKPIADACFSSGFNNLSNFNRHFRALKGMSPREYIRHFGSTTQQQGAGAEPVYKF